MKTSKLNALIGGTPSTPSAQFTPALNNIRSGGVLKSAVKKAAKAVPKAAPRMKQYGDKGYKPADGSGTGM